MDPRNHPPPAHQQQWPPPRSHFIPPPPPYPPQVPDLHHPQDWGIGRWNYGPSWEYPADKEDWAAKAEAWAALNTVTDTQHPRPLFTPVSRIKGQSSYHYADIHCSNHHYTANSGPSSVSRQQPVAYGQSQLAVPDWFKEELIKNKAILARLGPERPSDSIEDETFDKTPGRADQEDSQSIGSPRSAVEDDEEDNMEAVKTAEVNQEIKRILTEVLLKVTDNFFYEIATQALEKDLTTQVSDETVTPDRKSSSPIPAVPTSKASAKVLIAAKAEENETEDENGKSTSSSPGDLLGLAGYASDNDEDDADNSVQHQPSTKKLSEDDNTADNGTTQAMFEEDKSQVNGDTYKSEIVSNGATVQHDGNGKSKCSSNALSGLVADDNTCEGIKTVEGPGTSKPNNSVGKKITKNEDVHAKLPVVHDSRDGEIRNKQDKEDDIGETRESYVGRDNAKAGDRGKDRKGDKEDDRYEKRERKTDKINVSKEKIKVQGAKIGGKAKESDFKTEPNDPDIKRDKKDMKRYRRADDKDDNDRRREPKKNEREERSRDKHRSESSRHIRCRSRDESSDDTKRKLGTKKPILSPSPSLSRVRKRGRRSRSRSPAHRRRGL